MAGYLRWANLSPEQTAALQSAQSRFFQAVDVVPRPSKSLFRGVSGPKSCSEAKSSTQQTFSQVQQVVEKQFLPESSADAVHLRYSRRPTGELRQRQLQVRVCSWNLHGSVISQEDDLTLWLTPRLGKGVLRGRLKQKHLWKSMGSYGKPGEISGYSGFNMSFSCF